MSVPTEGQEIKRLHKEDLGKELDGVIVKAVRLIFSSGNFVIFACKGGFTVKGNSSCAITEGQNYEIKGHVGQYQNQLQIIANSIELVRNENTNTAYVASFLKDNLDGVGNKLSLQLAEKYKEEVLAALYENPDTVALEIDGLTLEKAEKIAIQVEKDKDYLGIILELRLLGLSNNQAKKAYEFMGPTCPDQIRRNPFVLMKISGIGFSACEAIAKQNNTEPLSIDRFAAAISSAVKEMHALNGDTYLEPLQVKSRTQTLINQASGGDIPNDIFNGIYDDAIVKANEEKYIAVYKFQDGKCMGCNVNDEGARIASRDYFGAEAAIKKEIENFLKARVVKPDEEETRRMIREKGEERGITLDNLQEDALYLCMYSPLAVITGGPGTGKTTITSILAQHFEEKNIKYEFCAPTGRAAKRLSEAAGVEASTIHRLLEMSAPKEEDGEDEPLFGRNRGNPLEARVVVADEASMIDTFLFKALLDALRPGASLILIGDPDQLPSVSAGNILADLLSCDVIPAVKLKYIFRQDEGGSIASNAVRILNGEYPVPGVDFDIIKTSSDEEALPYVIELSLKNKENDFVVLSPTRRGLLGIEDMNLALQAKHNEGSGDPLKVRTDLDLYPNDLVMQVKNNYRIEFYDPTTGSIANGVFNGEMGRIDDFDILTGKTNIIFDGDRKIGYDKKMLSDIELAYSVTVHKAQGCEFDSVLIVLGSMNYKLSNRRILYTAITRGRKKVTVIDSNNRLTKMLNSNGDFSRKTSLGDFLNIVASRH
ncbi:MAG: AAA family ATPase [Saccharofermentans sp.]|nr:AAA family ATPase [Saccharofermentans sp.]